ncbi:hypothetical protein SAMN05421693_11458 [Ectothiorhodospira magna]|uniref:J domain-containing protein n=1 Tax=Ectothiorhodospira magna TaxID=867345 RepID=A0A1H9CNT8_9GAMM|nr:molecular chaperone DnaJ [Ectothiorhodospira magna]SEQ02333.1 hypothetical protein SAMN05421693_11458 [Ectothiorhodospira magna]
MRDPFLLLNVSPQADDNTIHHAYLHAVKACPPERDPVGFDAVRQAYERIRSQRQRLAYELFDTTPPGIQDILDQACPVNEGGTRRPDLALCQALLRGER